MVTDATIIVLQWAAIGVTAVGLGATWVRNGRSTSEKYGQLEEKVDNVVKSVDEVKTEQKATNTKLDTITTCVNSQAVTCAKTSSDISARVSNNEKDISEIQRKI